MILGQRIRAVRMAEGMSQVELSRRCGVSKNYMHSLEQGQCPHPSFWHIWRIAQVLGVPLDALTCGVEPPPPGHQRTKRHQGVPS